MARRLLGAPIVSRPDPDQKLSPSISRSPRVSFSPLISCSISILAAWLALAMLASPARAEGPSPARTEALPPQPRKEIHAGGLLQGFASVQALGLDGRPFVDRAPYLAAGLRFKGAGTAVGGGLQMLFQAEGLRMGFDANFFTVRGVELAHKPLGSDLQASLSEPWGAEVAGLLGYELGFGHFHPYLDLRFGASFLVWSIDVHSNRLGDLTPISGTQTLPIVLPRLGIAYRFTNGLSFDLSTSAAPWGLARAGVFLGIGGYTEFPPERRPPPPPRGQQE